MSEEESKLEQTTWLLERLGHLLRAEMRQGAQRHELKLVQLEALYYLSRANRYSLTTLTVADALALTKGTTSQTLKALVEKGFVERRSDKDDGRVVHHDLTPAGQRVVAECYPVSALENLCQNHRGEDMNHLNKILTELLRSLQVEQGRVAFGVCNGCKYFGETAGGAVCGVTKEPLSKSDSLKICREFALPTEA
ncbi:MAG: MarR family transcriptional regulator [Kofleriaceae bacterium]|nr:MarR family transcriptional regulator [Kofleriaceae bacterium]